MKTCRKCGTLFDGRKCKVCEKAYREANKEKRNAYSIQWRLKNPDKVKELSQKWYALAGEKYRERSKQKRLADPQKCAAYMRQYHAAHKERHRERGKKWAAENRERVRAAQKEWRKKNPETVKKSGIKWYVTHKEQAAITSARWKAENPEARRIQDQNRKARVRKYGGKLSKGLVGKLFSLQRGLCACCRQPLGDKYHLDHIVPVIRGGKNEDWNMQLLTARCNLEKHAKDPIDFMQSKGFLL